MDEIADQLRRAEVAESMGRNKLGEVFEAKLDRRDVEAVYQSAIGVAVSDKEGCQCDKCKAKAKELFCMFNGRMYTGSVECWRRFHADLGEVLDKRDPTSTEEAEPQPLHPCNLCNGVTTEENSFPISSGARLHFDCGTGNPE